MSILTVRKKRTFKFLAVFTLVVMFGSFLASGIVAAEQYTVPSGTLVSVKTTSEISPENVAVGDKVDLVVVDNVIINGKVIIKAGAPATAEVTMVQKKGIVGAAAKIGITLLNAKAVNGGLVPLSGTKTIQGKDRVGESVVFTILCCLLFLFMPGEDAVIPADYQIDGTVSGTVVVTI